MRTVRFLRSIIKIIFCHQPHQHGHLDQLFHTIDNENEAVLIVVADVARPHPAVLVKGLLVGSFVVAGH